jgi:TolB-like protein
MRWLMSTPTKKTTMPIVTATKSGATKSRVSACMAMSLVSIRRNAHSAEAAGRPRRYRDLKLLLFPTGEGRVILGRKSERSGSHNMVQGKHAVSADLARAELQRILESPRFNASERNRGFLTYVVEQTLAGRTDRIKAYTIATEVFGRDAKFDPQLDSIVRIEAGRLRRSLERYYLTDGRTSHLRIDIPRGGYVPIFDFAEPVRVPHASAGPPRVLVTTFEEEGDQSCFPTFTRGFTRSLIIALTRFTGLRIFGSETALRHPAEVGHKAARPELAADYVVTGQTSLLPDRFEVDVLLVEAATGRVVWAETFERSLKPSEIIGLRNEVANRVGRALAQPYGAIQSDRARDADGRAPERLGSYAAVLLFYAYWQTFDREMIEAVRVGLERAVTTEPDYAEAISCLSLVYTNAFRFRHPINGPLQDPLERALALADRAIELAPNSSWARYALGVARWFAGDPDASLDALETGRRLNPNDTTILADLGQRYAMLARWSEAVPLLEESYATNLAQPGGYRIGLFLYHFAHGRYAEALADARRVNAPQVLYGHVATAAAAAELGIDDEAADAVAAIRALDPDYGARVVADLGSRHVAPELVSLIVAGLEKAGLPIAAPAPDPTPAS